MCKDPAACFGPGQYLLGDSAYPASQFLVPPYKAPDNRVRQNTQFNKLLSNVCIDIEHAFGMFKGRWRSLTGLRLRVNNKQQYEYACMWITACVVLYNIFLDLNDNWINTKGWWTAEEKKQHDKELLQLDKHEREEGADKKEKVKRIMLELS